jgi:hypothetical protein
MTTIRQLEAHGIPVTSVGKPLRTTTVVYDVDQLRSLLDLGLDQPGRQAHYEALFAGTQAAAQASGAAAATDDGGASLAHKIAAHVVGNTELTEQDRAEIAPVFPMKASVATAAGPLTVNTKYELSTSDGSMQIATFTDVTLEQNGYFVCESTPLIFTCNTLTRTGTSGSGAADFNILGKVGSTPTTPAAPAGATQAATGSNGECSSAGVAGNGGGAGNAGAQGTPGTAGAAGGAGTPSMQATITIQDTLTASQLTVYSQSGPGGQGGSGGQGGPGQQGGNGGNGATCDCTGNGGGPGGDGGNGGSGGAAGNGGNGANAAGNIVIRVPTQADVAKVITTTAPAPPGNPGTPGPGGAPGGGGSGGSAGKNNSGGGSGGTGSYGASGAQGQPGSVSGTPAQITVMPVLESGTLGLWVGAGPPPAPRACTRWRWRLTHSKPDGSPAPRRTISGSGWEKSITVVGSVPQSPESITASTTWSSSSAICHPSVIGSSWPGSSSVLETSGSPSSASSAWVTTWRGIRTPTVFFPGCCSRRGTSLVAGRMKV